MPAFHKATTVNASPERAWQVVGDLEVMGRMAGASKVQVDGMTRVCTFANGAVLHEQITNYSAQERSYNYNIEGSPLPVRNNRGAFAIASEAGQTSIVWDAEFELIGASQTDTVSAMWHGAMDQVLQSIKPVIEAAA